MRVPVVIGAVIGAVVAAIRVVIVVTGTGTVGVRLANFIVVRVADVRLLIVVIGCAGTMRAIVITPLLVIAVVIVIIALVIIIAIISEVSLAVLLLSKSRAKEGERGGKFEHP